MKVASLFAGIGGFDLALLRAGHEIIYANEWNKYAAQIYDKNFTESNREQQQNEEVGESASSVISKGKQPIKSKVGRNYPSIDTRDIREVKDIPDHDLLTAGFPCQSFSIAGQRGGFDDTRGTLFFEIARIAKQKQPRLLLLENVKGLLSHDSGNTFRTILKTLDELGYDLQWQVLNSKNFGVPQNRERVFIIGHLRGTPRPQVFPLTQSSKSHLKYSGGVISARKQWLKDGKHNSRNFSQGQRIYSTDGISQCLAGNAGGQGGKTGLYATPKIVRPVLSPDRAKKRQNGRRMKNDGEPSFTLTGQDRHGVMTNSKIRRLTPLECERLQGFPDGWTEGISDTQRYKCLGNAVTVNVVEAIVKHLVK